MTVQLRRWWTLDDVEAGALAASIAERVGATLVGVAPHEYAGRPGRTALFELRGRRYAFVPGAEAGLGYDGTRFVPTPEQRESFAVAADEYGLQSGLQEFVDSMTSPPRTAEVPPMLVSVEAVDAAETPVPPDHPHITELLAKMRGTLRDHPQPPEITWYQQARVVLGHDWTVRAAWLIEVPTYGAAVERLAAAGQRLLTPDEWEYACGAGAATLFRWGDDSPPDDPYSSATGPHRLPNAFGLEIGQDPYRDERTADPEVVCGGDGGGMLCGGAGGFLSWLTLATAYRDVEHGRWAHERDGDASGLLLRPVIPLD
ncbi:hypothetical protein AB0J86_10510 [Micromonospora sp. NPDC049559]|uniref:hypothetical protein n=1 Tax=Micromonospora sp. NPDC049559 TaxID=3155923 RepID=UPI0034323DE3